MKMRIPWFRAPYRLAIVHTVLILFFMFAWSQRWFLSPTPFDCAYAPLFFVSGPVVHTIAHATQHWAERVLFPEAPLWFRWNIVPGAVCLILGGLQWFLIELLWCRVKGRMKQAREARTTGCSPISNRADAV